MRRTSITKEDIQDGSINLVEYAHIVSETDNYGKTYYLIQYKLITGECYEGYGSYYLDVVQDWFENSFIMIKVDALVEIVNEMLIK